ncbi:AAA family ATPase [Amycolatopsis sp. PS_44_ISF1]|uniref:helix-turn-helix transcriptional regulator n=1 Tax=Amycolatopsis sp. PS_44_ISF1 TaxID=2974917 RepID=UPI0028DFA567|nr:AAA family ATPase [Amycolatopsis sp. PS_44_ISF1]MDT8913094.1 AAA family ATPase [Amycolatopsis sp. PS_44_ISF1]
MGFRSPRVVGRDHEITVLRQMTGELETGRGGTVFLVGEGGIGKSRLAAEAAGRALAAGRPVLRGRASSIGPMVPFRPLAEALLSHFRGGRPPELPELDAYLPVLAQLVPDWDRRDRPHQGGSLVVLAEAVLRLLSATARDGGCLVVLEDLHDADAETLFILEYLVDNLAGAGALLVATQRDEPGDALRLAQEASRRGSANLLRLGRLGRAHTRELAAGCLETEPGRVPDAAIDLLWHTSDGNPFAVEELLHGMVGEGLLVDGPEGWQVISEPRTRVPSALVTTIAGRVAQLGAEAEALLSAAAILGLRFPPAIVQQVTGLDDHTLHSHLSAAVSAQLVTTDETTPGWYAFRHPLTVEALLARLTPSAKADLAARAADAVEARYPELPDELCALVASLRLTALDEPAAGRLFSEAGQRALRAGAADSAVTLLTQAQRLLANAEPAERAAVLGALLTALGQTGQFDRAVELTSGFTETGFLEQAAQVHTQLAWVAYVAGRHEDCLSQIGQARSLLGPPAPPGQQSALDAVEATLWLDVPGPDHTQRAERLARRAWQAAESPSVACQALQALGVVVLERDLDESEEYLHRARRIAEENRLHHLHTQVLARIGGHRVLADGDEGFLDLARAEARRTGAITLSCTVDSTRTMHAIMRGEFAVAAGLIESNQPVLTRLKLTALSQYLLMTRAMAAAHRADRAGMELALEEFLAAGGQNAQEMVLCLGLARTFCSLLEENPERARRELAQVDAMEENQPSRFHLSGRHGLRLLLDALAGGPGAAGGTHAARRMRWNRQFNRLADAVVLGREGLVARANEAVAEALEATAPYPVARHLALRLVAETAAADGWGDPVTWLKNAEEYFHSAGVPAVASACRGLLRRTGVHVQQRRTGFDRVPASLRSNGVTVREYEVLQLLADRMGNKDVAQRLHISPRTVEKHVASLMTKLGHRSRAELTEDASVRHGR